MRVLLSGGIKTDNIIKAIDKKFQASGDDFLVVDYLDNIGEIFGRGEYFDKAIITEQSITREMTITDEFEIRQRVNNFAIEMSRKPKRYEYVFLVSTEELACMVHEEILPIMADSVVVVKKPKYSVTFFVSLIVSDIGQLDPEIVYTPPLEIPMEVEEDNSSAELEELEVTENYTPKKASGDITGMLFGDENSLTDKISNELDIDKGVGEDETQKATPVDEDWDTFNTDSDNSAEDSWGTDGDSEAWGTDGEGFNFDNEGQNDNNEGWGTDGDNDNWGEVPNSDEGWDNIGTEDNNDAGWDTFNTDDNNDAGWDTFNTDDNLDNTLGTEDNNINDDVSIDLENVEPIKQSEELPNFVDNSVPEQTFETFEEEQPLEQIEPVDNINDVPLAGFDDENENEYNFGDELYKADQSRDNINTADSKELNIDSDGFSAFPTEDEYSGEEFNFEPDGFTTEGFEPDGYTDDNNDNNFSNDNNFNNEQDNFNNDNTNELPVNNIDNIAGFDGDDYDDDRLDIANDYQNNIDNQVNQQENAMGFNPDDYKEEDNSNKQQADDIETLNTNNRQQKRGLFGKLIGKRNAQDTNPGINVQAPIESMTGGKGRINVDQVRNSLKPFAARGNSIVVTGCGGCGTSTVAYNLANIICQLGYTVLLVDMDTEGRTQSYISKQNYESMEQEGANLMSAVNSSNGINTHVSIVKTGFHLLTMGLATDTAPASELLHKDKISRFVNLTKTSHNFVIYDIPFDSAVGFLSDITYMCDNLVLVTDASNWGITKTMLSVCNIGSDDMQDTVFSRAQFVFNKYRNLYRVLGKKVKTCADITRVMDQKVLELVGDDPGFHFADLHIAGIINDDPDFENGWFEDVQYSDTKKGQDIFLELIEHIVLKK